VAQSRFNFLAPSIVQGWTRGVRFFARFFIQAEINPNWFTVLGLVISFIASILLARGEFLLGGLVIAIAGSCDMIDGMVARELGRVSKFGALFDSVIDRYSEVIVFFGLCYYYVEQDMMITSVVVAAALAGSLMVSYVRARAEGLGLDCKVGMMQRPERLAYLSAGSTFTGVFSADWIVIVVIWIIAIFANMTAIQRLLHIWKSTEGKHDVPEGTGPGSGHPE
jgi:CDP-diacylglycerol---glycerol-3-phosphate 3-phosphatidyltransferase